MVAFKRAVSASFVLPGGEVLIQTSRHAAPQSLGGRYHHELAPLICSRVGSSRRSQIFFLRQFNVSAVQT